VRAKFQEFRRYVVKRFLSIGDAATPLLFTEVCQACQINNETGMAFLSRLTSDSVASWSGDVNISASLAIHPLRLKHAELRALLGARLAIETLCVSMLAQQARAADIEALMGAVEQMRGLGIPTTDDEVAVFTEADREFHVLLARSAGFEILIPLLESWFYTTSLALHSLRIAGRGTEIPNEHADIVREIQNKDPIASCFRVRAHLVNGSRYVSGDMELLLDSEIPFLFGGKSLGDGAVAPANILPAPGEEI
jgi:hypothetical protein